MEIKYAPIPEFSSRLDGKGISSINNHRYTIKKKIHLHLWKITTGTGINNSSENNTEQTASVEHVLLNCKDCFSRLELNTSKILTYSKKIYQSWQSSSIT